MTAPSSAIRMPGAIGIVGLTPALAESLRPLLRAAGYALGEYRAEREQVACVAGDVVADGALTAALVILEGASPAPLPVADQLPRIPVDRPFTPERLLVAVALAWSEVEARRVAIEQFAQVTVLYQQATAICDDLDRDPPEVAAALVALLHEAGGYADVRVTFGDASRLYEVPRSARMLRVPIVVEGELIGHICATVAEASVEWSALGDHRRLLETVAACAGTYWSRRDERERVARLRAEDLRRVEELAAVNEVALATASLDLDQVLAELLPRARTLLAADYCTLVLRDLDSDILTIRAADGLGADQLVDVRLPAEQSERSFSRQIIEAGTSQRWRPGDEASVATVAALVHPETQPHAAIGAPLLAQGRAIGTIVAANRRAAYFTETDLRFLTTVAAQAAVAVENARLYADTLRLARFDALTGLANRRYFLEQLAQAVETASRYERPLALLIIDLDHFKSVNDNFGHLAGDALLRAIADRLRTRLRRSDFPARYAGDELAAILPETTLSGATALAERLRSVVAETPLLTGEAMPARLTLSVGVAVYTPGSTVTDFLRAADSALYFAKHEGRNRVCGPDAAQAALTGSADDLATILRGGNQAVIEELAAAVDARVAQTAGQAALVAATAIALGEALGLAPEDLDTLRSAALVHDIGEVAIAPDVLGRSGPLGTRELALVRAHPRRSYDLLAAVPAFQGALPLILHHHERWDGGGYPDGLVGEAIPIGARIIAVADAWVALTTDRPYRAALAPAEALAEIAQGSGKQFDPVVAIALPQAISRRGRGARSRH